MSGRYNNQDVQKNMSLTSSQLLQIFEDEMNSSAPPTLLGERTNPCHILFKGVEFYVYIKNISSAYFSNPDVSRIQLTGVDTLNAIKQSEALFVLLGYDSENRVFATWNPYFAKQRIGTSSSPSLYSRFSWQKEAALQNSFIKRELKNYGLVIIFPQEYISVFLGEIKELFTDTSEYVAIGSKRRSSANAAYRELVNTQHLGEFSKYLSNNSYSKSDVALYVNAVKLLLNSSIFSSNRKIFLACNSLAEYSDAASRFLSLDEIKRLDAEHDDVFSYAFPVYIDFLIESYDEDQGCEKQETEEMLSDVYDGGEKDTIELVSEESEGSVTQPEDVDYETSFIDESGNLTCIANPILIDLLRNDLDSEYPRYIAAYSTIEEFYGNRFPNMELRHWQLLFNKINWKAPYVTPAPIHQVKKRRSVRQKIKVVFPDGHAVCDNMVVNTMLEVINYAGIAEVAALGITMGKNGGSQLIVTDINEQYDTSYKPLGNGLYVNTCSSTRTKFLQLQKINGSLKLGLVITIE